MKALLALLGLAVALLAAPAFAQSNVTVNCVAGSTMTGAPNPQPASTTNPCPVQTSPSSTGGVAPTSSSALVANLTAKASAGNLYSFQVSADSTLSGAAWWVMVYNAASAPADGAVTPALCYALASGTTHFEAAFGSIGTAFSTGITIGVSTTGCFSKTASAHAFVSGDAE